MSKAFDKTEEILASEADLNPGMIDVREKARAIAKAAADPTQRARIDEVIRKLAIPSFLGEIPKMGKQVNGWIRPRIIGNYRSDYVMRSITNYAGIWANNSKEVVYFTAQGLDGSQTFTQTYPKDALPRRRHAISGRSSSSMAPTTKSSPIRSTVTCSTSSRR